MLSRKILFLVVSWVLLAPCALGQALTIQIAAPPDGSAVEHRPVVQGKVSDPNANVRIIVHPLEGSDYWVQPQPSVNEKGTWRVMVYIGRPGPEDVGKGFEILAIANPQTELREGKLPAGDWPKAKAKSKLITVKRK